MVWAYGFVDFNDGSKAIHGVTLSLLIGSDTLIVWPVY